jgi:hypothetical protein
LAPPWADGTGTESAEEGTAVNTCSQALSGNREQWESYETCAILLGVFSLKALHSPP